MSQKADNDSADNQKEPIALADEDLDAVSGGIGSATRGPGRAKPFIGLEQEGRSEPGGSRKGYETGGISRGG